jgi:hypothetical protein
MAEQARRVDQNAGMSETTVGRAQGAIPMSKLAQ